MKDKIAEYSLSGPTKESVLKMTYIQCENALNVPIKELNGRTFLRTQL